MVLWNMAQCVPVAETSSSNKKDAVQVEQEAENGEVPASQGCTRQAALEG